MKSITCILLSLLFFSCTEQTEHPPVTTTDSTVLMPSDPMLNIDVDTDDYNTGSHPTNTLDSTVPIITPKDTASY